MHLVIHTDMLKNFIHLKPMQYFINIVIYLPIDYLSIVLPLTLLRLTTFTQSWFWLFGRPSRSPLLTHLTRL